MGKLGQADKNLIARTGQLGPDNRDMTAGAGQPVQDSRDRIFWTRQRGHSRRDITVKTGKIGQPYYNSKDRAAGTRQPGQGNHGRRTMTEQPDRTYWTGHPGPDSLDLTAGTGQFGQISLTLSLDRIERKG
jgi:hypothetical protein